MDDRSQRTDGASGGRRLDGGLSDALQLELISLSEKLAVVALDVGPVHLQGDGIVHGGTYCTLVETAASLGASQSCGEEKRVVGVSNKTDFIRPSSGGRLVAMATPIAQGRTQQLWMVEVRDADDQLVARGDVRLQNIQR